MKKYKRHSFVPECNNPEPLLFHPESDFGDAFKHDLIDSCSCNAWWEYLLWGSLLVILLVVIYLGVAWWAALILIGVIVLSAAGSALSTAWMYQKLNAADATICVDEEGVHYAVAVPEDNDGRMRDDIPDGENITVRKATSSSWQELNEIRVFDDFITLHFVPTSKLRLVFIPMDVDQEHKDEYINNILAYWHQNADNIPQGFDRRLLYVLLFIALIALRFTLKFIRRKYM